MDDVTWRHGSERSVVSPMSALVVASPLTVGEPVARGAVVCVTETMKCESVIRSPIDGWVLAVPTVGVTVDAGEELARISTFAPSPHRVRWSPEHVLELLCHEPGGGSPWLPEAVTGSFVHHDLVDGELVPVESGRGERAGVVVGVVSHEVAGHPGGLRRVLVLGDPSQSMGAVGEAECRRIIAAIEMAAESGMAVEWVALSAGARVAWDSGTENMDWCASVARAIVTFTQAGGTINVIVAGVNVGAQSYWNALATMLWHTAGVLVMVAEHPMVLTGRRALTLSGGGAHESEAAMGGYSEVMGPNGEAHHVAVDLPAAYRIMFDHLSLCQPRTDGTRPHHPTTDRPDRSVSDSPYQGPGDFRTVGDVLDPSQNPTRKLPFAIRPVMHALRDQDAGVLERWPDQADSHPAIVWDTRLDGWPVTIIGIESQPRLARGLAEPRLRPSGTLFPQASRKIARAINHASGRRGLVLLANLAGFDGSAESMRNRQLEYGAEIARAVVNFDGPLVVVVIGRFHGGAYVVFSRALNLGVRILALEGTYVSVIGGDAAAGVVFARQLREAVAAELETTDLTGAELDRYRRHVEATHRDRLAREFDARHNVDRAAAVGSIDAIVTPSDLRPEVIELFDSWYRAEGRRTALR